MPAAVDANSGIANQNASNAKCRMIPGSRPNSRYSRPNPIDGTISSTGLAYAGCVGYGACPAPNTIACTTNAITIQSRRLPSRSPMRAAPAIGTARNIDSSQKPAWNERAMAVNHGTYDASTSGLKRPSDGVHQPSDRIANTYRGT